MYEDKDKIQHPFMLRILSKLELEISIKEITGLQKRKKKQNHETTHNSYLTLNDEMLITFPPSWGTGHQCPLHPLSPLLLNSARRSVSEARERKKWCNCLA